MSISPRDENQKSDLVRIDRAVDLITGAIARQVRRFNGTQIPNEETLTAQLVGAMTQAIDGISAFGVRWDAMVLEKATEEPEHGADLLSIVDIQLSQYSVSKGFLAQAKVVRPKRRNPDDREKLVEQCKTMLARTKAAYVFVYKRGEDVKVLPASSVVAADGRTALLNYLPIGDFYRDHFHCFFGDPAVSAARPETLEALAEEVAARRAVRISARYDDQLDPFREG